jgi:hypothetical protein
VIVAGACRGYNRAFRVTSQYVIAYLVVGLVVILIAGLLVVIAHGVSEFLGAFMLLHVWLCMCLFPVAMVSNMVFVRIFKRRTWRHETRRKWVAGGLGVVLTWGGMILLEVFGIRTSEILRTLFGPMAEFLHYCGWFVLLSNVALLVGWTVPSRPTPPRDPVSGFRSSVPP